MLGIPGSVDGSSRSSLVGLRVQVGPEEDDSAGRLAESDRVVGRAHAHGPRGGRALRQVRGESAPGLRRLFCSDHGDGTGTEPLPGEPEIDLRGRLEVVPPRLAVGLPDEHPGRPGRTGRRVRADGR